MNPTAIDLFAGAGGATQGLKDAGLDVIAAVENDRHAAASFALNHQGVVLAEADIRLVDPFVLRRFLGIDRGSLALLKACPPCQGFSSLARGEIDEARNDLVLDTLRFAMEFRPAVVLLENVPGLGSDRRLDKLLAALSSLGYRSARYRVDAAAFGVPQRRRRLIVMAFRQDIGPQELPSDLIDVLPPSFDPSAVTVAMAFDRLDRHLASTSSMDPLNRARTSKREVAARIAAIPVGGGRFDLPVEHRLACHDRLAEAGQRVATASYGRVKLDQQSPTITTRCTTPSCGSFVHPTLNRGLTLREAATLQTFPFSYAFAGGYDSVERQIGNAVPVRMAQALGLIATALSV